MASAHEVESIVRAVLAEQKAASPPDLDSVVLKTISTILTSFGIEEEDRRELQADFRHLRKWRKSVESAQSITFKVAIGTIASGILGAFWLGFKSLMGK